MTLAIKWGDPQKTEEFSGFIYIDSVSSYTKDFRGQVTKHPVDTGANISDHFISENPVYNISGVISGTDLSSIPYYVRDQEGNRPFNAQQQPTSISLNSSSQGLLQYIPDSVAQFLNLSGPTVEVFGNTRTDLTYEIASKDLFEKILTGLKFNEQTNKTESNIQLVQLYEFDGVNIRDIIDDLVITSFRVREDVDTGDALFLDLTLEGVRFAYIERVKIPQDVQQDLKKKVASNKAKGNVSAANKDLDKAQEDKDTSAPTTDSSTLKKRFSLGQSITE